MSIELQIDDYENCQHDTIINNTPRRDNNNLNIYNKLLSFYSVMVQVHYMQT